jgi:hypothetical protein
MLQTFLNLKKITFSTLSILIIFSAFFMMNISAQAGSLAQTIKDLDMKKGAGNAYATIKVVESKTNVIVERCSNRWCFISAKSTKGWVSIDGLTFGVEARGPWSGPKLNQVLQGSGEICFYTGVNFTGRVICSSTGMVVRDLALFGRDNSFSSISIEGKISAMVCRDFNFTSYCETIIKSQPVLNKLLRRKISSYRVW